MVGFDLQCSRFSSHNIFPALKITLSTHYQQLRSAMMTAERFFHLGRNIAEIEFNKSIAGCYRDGNAEYDAVGVLLLTWAEDDMNCKEIEVNPLEQVFKEKFNYHTEQYEIPSTEPDTSLFNRLDAFVRCYDSPSKLGIIYYGQSPRQDHV
jgi:hypothetical protein